MEIPALRQLVWQYYKNSGRALPWREEPFDAYKILVSEIMLQQTQVNRVILKYHTFLEKFPTLQALAAAPLADVLQEWSGLGYNRRAQYLHEAAKKLTMQTEPWQPADLIACKGIGHNTAAAVMVYAYNQPCTFIETNIRTVFIHHFFPDRKDITDKELLPLIEAALDTKRPREWYWALMDYGAYLKKTIGNTAQRSRHYSKQSRFEGSRRQLRGTLLRQLARKPQSFASLQKSISDERLAEVLAALQAEKLIRQKKSKFYLG